MDKVQYINSAKVHYTQTFGTGITTLCNPGIFIGSILGNQTFLSVGWDRANLSETVTCIKCQRIEKKNNV